MEKDSPLTPHVLIFPMPAQGHVNSMLNLAELLAVAGLHVTFLNSDYNHQRLIRHSDVQIRLSRYPGFQFRSISDGLPADHVLRSADRFNDWLHVFMSKAKQNLKDFLVSGIDPPVNCIIADGIMGFAVDVGEELRLPVIHFRTIGASCFWTYFSIPRMIQASELPIKVEKSEDMDGLIKSVPGMETFLRRRDLPGFCRATDLSDPTFQIVSQATQQTPRARALILNTFEDLEPSSLSLIRTTCPKTYTIGPLHAHIKTRLAEKATPSQSQPSSGNSFLEVNKSCMTWLESQPPRSVIYVSFGSIAVVTREQLMEFWHGLVNSKKRFLWVMRPDSVISAGESGVPAELEEGTRERGYMVGWAPQEEVLAHCSVGGFLTHSGWNSTLESVAAGVPMLCWPFSADQQLNSRLVSHVWKIGLDMKDVCDRKVIKEMINDLMVEKRDEFVKSADRMAKLALASVGDGGSSYCNLDRLIQDIRLLSKENL